MATKIHFRKVLKIGNKKKIYPLCYNTQILDLQTTIDKKKITCNKCKLKLMENAIQTRT